MKPYTNIDNQMTMNVSVIEDPLLNANELILKCHQVNAEIEKVKQYAKNLNTSLIGYLDGKQYLLNTTEIYYFESVDKQTFAYLEKQVLKCDLKLYELDEILHHTFFARISKSTVINLLHIESIRPLINRNLCIELTNHENVICSRRYVSSIKKHLKEGSYK